MDNIESCINRKAITSTTKQESPFSIFEFCFFLLDLKNLEHFTWSSAQVSIHRWVHFQVPSPPTALHGQRWILLKWKVHDLDYNTREPLFRHSNLVSFYLALKTWKFLRDRQFGLAFIDEYIFNCLCFLRRCMDSVASYINGKVMTSTTIQESPFLEIRIWSLFIGL
jgi:hypothetical protein